MDKRYATVQYPFVLDHDPWAFPWEAVRIDTVRRLSADGMGAIIIEVGPVDAAAQDDVTTVIAFIPEVFPWETARTEALQLSTEGMGVLIIDVGSVDVAVDTLVVAFVYEQEVYTCPNMEGGSA